MLSITTDLSAMIHIEETSLVGSVLKEDGLALLPTDTVWSIACDFNRLTGVKRLYRLCTDLGIPHFPEILVDSLDMFKSLVPDLHPRLETLLVYHHRPLTILCEGPSVSRPELSNENGLIAVRLTRDVFCTQVIQHIQGPLATCFASPSHAVLPTTFGTVSSAILERMDYVAKYGRKEEREGPAVMVQLGDEFGELEFLRD